LQNEQRDPAHARFGGQGPTGAIAVDALAQGSLVASVHHEHAPASAAPAALCKGHFIAYAIAGKHNLLLFAGQEQPMRRARPAAAGVTRDRAGRWRSWRAGRLAAAARAQLLGHTRT